MLKIKCLKSRQYLSPLYSKQPIARSELEKFENTLQDYLEKTEQQLAAQQSEPNIVSNALKPFFESLGYVAQSYSQKGQSGIDLALIQENEPAVIIEAKAPGSAGMITPGEINRKAFHEAVLYFMRERARGNRSIYHIVITDFYRWFVFDAKEFERLFWQNKRVRRIFESVMNPSVLGSRTEDFYRLLSEEIASMQENLIEDREIEAACFDLRDQRSERQNAALYKVFSKETLLKAFNPNDANTLNKEFYNELLYIMGLEERKEGSKKIISRARHPQMASLYENTARNLKYAGYPSDFETVLRLNIIWINRILFLKLLEAQLLRWNGGEERYRFLNIHTIEDFDRLKIFFFDILANPQEKRSHKEYPQIPYLNSSLFEISPVERRYIDISTLEDHCELPYYSKTVLKDARGRRREGAVDMLQYLFEFLDAYDFASEGGEEIVAQSKTLINAAVLGLIFEKLNGYREGSYYTPSFVTMYMSRETIERAVLEKFNRLKGWSCKNLDELDDRIEDKKEANEIIDSLTICDPAVGSGHFLVSALNAILEIKSRLRILYDAEGRRIKDYTLEVKNDELLILDDEKELFGYRNNSREKGRIQKAIFEEKKKIIENSLFGVDINPNAAQIARLRLWIELLKHSYYDHNGRLVTMPNIDINIKVGNSLVSRYGLHDEITIPNIRHKIEEYKALVREYKEGAFETTKAQMQQVIEDIKSMFGLTLQEQWKQTKRYKKILYEYVREFGFEGLSREMQLDALDFNFGRHARLFDDEIDSEGVKEREVMLKKLKDAYDQIEEIRAGVIYENAFEWRFEFPEVLDEEGNFLGFDAILANPPYILEDENKKVFEGLHESECYQGKTDIWHLFACRAIDLICDNGHISFIAKNQWLESSAASKMRRKIYDNTEILNIIDFGPNMVFEEASQQTMIFLLQKRKVEKHQIHFIKFTKRLPLERIASILDEGSPQDHQGEVAYGIKEIPRVFNEKENLKFSSDLHEKILNKIDAHKNFEFDPKKEIIQGIIGGPDKAFIVDEDTLDIFSGDERSYLRNFHTNTQRYYTPPSEKYIFYLTKENCEDISKYPEIEKILMPYKRYEEKGKEKGLELRREVIKGSIQWFHLWWARDESFFMKGPKIAFAARTHGRNFTYTEESFYGSRNLFFIKSDRVDLKYIVALLNSKLIYFYMQERLKHNGELLQIDKNQFMKVPLFVPEDTQVFDKLVDEIIEKKKSGEATDELEARIDRMVYELYGLSDEEIGIVERSLQEGGR